MGHPFWGIEKPNPIPSCGNCTLLKRPNSWAVCVCRRVVRRQKGLKRKETKHGHSCKRCHALSAKLLLLPYQKACHAQYHTPTKRMPYVWQAVLFMAFSFCMAICMAFWHSFQVWFDLHLNSQNTGLTKFPGTTSPETSNFQIDHPWGQRDDMIFGEKTRNGAVLWNPFLGPYPHPL